MWELDPWGQSKNMPSVNLSHRSYGCPWHALDLEEMTGVDREVVMGKEKLCALDKELSGW